MESPREVCRARFVEVIRDSEHHLESTINQTIAALVELRQLLQRVCEAEDDGLRVRYYETAKSVLFTSEPKGHIGFLGGTNGHPLDVDVQGREGSEEGGDPEVSQLRDDGGCIPSGPSSP